MIQFVCPVCNSTLKAPPAQAGAKFPCPRCGQRLQVPTPNPSRTVLGRLAPDPDPAPAAPAGGPAAPSTSPADPRDRGLWCYRHEGKEAGPVPWQELRRLASEGNLRPEDEVWTQGMGKWLAAGKLQGLMPTDRGHPRP